MPNKGTDQLINLHIGKLNVDRENKNNLYTKRLFSYFNLVQANLFLFHLFDVLKG